MSKLGDQDRDVILFRLWSRANAHIRKMRARGWSEPELLALEQQLDAAIERIYGRIIDRHPERIGY